MIFVTVGTHEQQFNRLIKEVDELKKEGVIKDDVFMQIGFSDYQPSYCEYSKMLDYADMEKWVKAADIVITHGGPSSFIMPLQYGKVPIVVPRMETYEEHVNNHQVEFVYEIEKRMNNIIGVYDIRELKHNILDYDNIVKSYSSALDGNNSRFCSQLETIIDSLF